LESYIVVKASAAVIQRLRSIEWSRCGRSLTAVLELVKGSTFSGGDFSIQADGVCRLNPELARRVAQAALSLCSAALHHASAYSGSNLAE
jgi:hypothetical protein